MPVRQVSSQPASGSSTPVSDIHESDFQAKEASETRATAHPKSLHSRTVRVQGKVARDPVKFTLTVQIEKYLQALAAGTAGSADSVLEEIQSNADKLWRPGLRTERLRTYFLRILPNMNQAQRDAIAQTLAEIEGGSAIRTALTAALQSPAASRPRRSISARHKLADGFRSLRSSMGVKVTTTPAARQRATEREAGPACDAAERTAHRATRPGYRTAEQDRHPVAHPRRP